MKNVYTIVVVIVIIVAGLMLRANFKKELRNSTRSELSSVCSDKQECKAALNAHFDACFDTIGTDLAGRRIDKAALVGCINGRAGKEVLTATAR